MEFEARSCLTGNANFVGLRFAVSSLVQACYDWHEASSLILLQPVDLFSLAVIQYVK